MNWRFKDDGLARLWADPDDDAGHSAIVVKAFRKHIQRIDAALTERDFGGRFERLKYKRSHQYSMRLDQQWRLILEFEGEGEDRCAVIIGIEDYHRRER